MGHYDEDIHCKICGEYLGTYVRKERAANWKLGIGNGSY